jgi:hypothetical protein
MKNLITLIAAVVLVAVAATANAQVTGTATGSATIITPIGIANAGNMNFGNIAVSTTAGTVVLSTAGSRAAFGGVTLPATVGTVGTANFTVSGLGNSTYSIQLPSTYTITRQTGTETMTVNAFTSNPSGAGTLAAGGTQTINVGATLNVAGSQVAGTYTNASGFNVTVNYN